MFFHSKFRPKNSIFLRSKFQKFRFRFEGKDTVLRNLFRTHYGVNRMTIYKIVLANGKELTPGHQDNESTFKAFNAFISNDKHILAGATLYFVSKERSAVHLKQECFPRDRYPQLYKGLTPWSSVPGGIEPELSNWSVVNSSHEGGKPVTSLDSIATDVDGNFKVQCEFKATVLKRAEAPLPYKEPKESYTFLSTIGMQSLGGALTTHAIMFYKQPIADPESGTQPGWYKVDSQFGVEEKIRKYFGYLARCEEKMCI